MENVCRKNRVERSIDNIDPDKFKNIYVDDKHQLLYCSVPKVACTNWKRILLVLSGRLNTSHPMDISPSLVHSPQYTNYLRTLSSYSVDEVQHRLEKYLKFMFVREPLERILSAYLNKFTMGYNDYFRKRYGRKIVKRFRKRPSAHALKYGDDVTFLEFVRYLVSDHIRPLNSHWRQYYKLCFPCVVRYDVIGKYETMQRDVQYVLEEARIGQKLKFPRSNKNPRLPKTSEMLQKSYSKLDPELVHKLWELYSVDYAMFGYKYPELVKRYSQGEDQ